MMRVPFQAGDDQADDRNREFRPRQIDRDYPSETAGGEPVERPAQIAAEIVMLKSGDIAKGGQARFARQRVEQEIGDFGSRRFRVICRGQVVANAGDKGQAGLRRLGQGASERDPAIGMAAGAVKAAQPPRLIRGGIADFAKKRGDADIARDIPGPHFDPGRRRIFRAASGNRHRPPR